jgi:hypothetical protein
VGVVGEWKGSGRGVGRGVVGEWQGSGRGEVGE